MKVKVLITSMAMLLGMASCKVIDSELATTHPEDCTSQIGAWKKEVERLRTLVEKDKKTNADGSMSSNERKLMEAQNKLDNCRFNHTDYGKDQHLGYDASSVKPRSFSETCRIINGNRVCDMEFHDKGDKQTEQFTCTNFSGTTKQVLQENGIPCSINAYNTSRVGGGHANNIVQVASTDPTKDRFCMLEPQSNKLTDCWYVKKGTGPGKPPSYAYEKNTIPNKIGMGSMIPHSSDEAWDADNLMSPDDEKRLRELGVQVDKLPAIKNGCRDAWYAKKRYCDHFYGTGLEGFWYNYLHSNCVKEADRELNACMNR